MSILHIRNVPGGLHRRIRKLAETERCSLSAEVVRLLKGAVTDREMRLNQATVLDEIRRTRFTPSDAAPDSLSLLREDRGR